MAGTATGLTRGSVAGPASGSARAGRRAERWVSVAGDLLLGAACPGCGRAGVGLCADCRFALAGAEPYPTRPTPCPPGFPRTIAGGPYDDLLRNLISAHKERQAWLLTPALGRRLAGSVAPLLLTEPGPVYLVPVPSSAAAVRSRGRDATAAIATAAARRLNAQHIVGPAGPGAGRAAGRSEHRIRVVRLLRPVRQLADQSDLTEAERHANLAGAYAVRTALLPSQPGPVIVVDDLVTTGSSLTEATRSLTAAGLVVAGAAVIAATVRRTSR